MAEVAYKEIANYGDYYMMISTVPKYSEEYDARNGEKIIRINQTDQQSQCQ